MLLACCKPAIVNVNQHKKNKKKILMCGFQRASIKTVNKPRFGTKKKTKKLYRICIIELGNKETWYGSKEKIN